MAAETILSLPQLVDLRAEANANDLAVCAAPLGELHLRPLTYREFSLATHRLANAYAAIPSLKPEPSKRQHNVGLYSLNGVDYMLAEVCSYSAPCCKAERRADRAATSRSHTNYGLPQ